MKQPPEQNTAKTNLFPILLFCLFVLLIFWWVAVVVVLFFNFPCYYSLRDIQSRSEISTNSINQLVDSSHDKNVPIAFIPFSPALPPSPTIRRHRSDAPSPNYASHSPFLFTQIKNRMNQFLPLMEKAQHSARADVIRCQHIHFPNELDSLLLKRLYRFSSELRMLEAN